MILVAGATGVLGSEIVRRLLARGEKVRAMVRAPSNPEAVERLRKAGAETIVGDLKDPTSLRPACAGVDAVIPGVPAGTRQTVGGRASQEKRTGLYDSASIALLRIVAWANAVRGPGCWNRPDLR